MVEQNTQADTTIHFQLTALDTWFFRESRPHDAAGASELSSLFPPPVRTVAGAIRTFLGDSVNIDWQAYSKGNGSVHDETGLDFKQAVGDSDTLGKLSIRGVWVTRAGKNLYPVPLYLMHKEKQLARLQIGDRVSCDLGYVRLPELPESLEKGYKNIEQSWVTAKGMSRLLQGKLPDNTDIVSLEQLLQAESRLGISRDNSTRSVTDGQLYQTRHLRFKDDVAIALNISGLEPRLAAKLNSGQADIIRLGGEGRMAALNILPDSENMPGLKPDSQPLSKFIIHFITAADFDGQMFPDSFKAVAENGQVIHWQGSLQGIELIIEAAVIGKVHREGGWDMKQHRPRAVKSYIPAGSAWFCRLADPSVSRETLINALHETCIGRDTQWGRGQILIGNWTDNYQGEINGNK